MRKDFDSQLRLDCLSIGQLQLNYRCRDEMIPLLKGLQHLYLTPELYQQAMALVQADVNAETSSRRGRPGMHYWRILVLSVLRYACQFDYDKLQDQVENHRNLRRIMGIGEWENDPLDARTIESNVCKLLPETLAKLSDLVVGEGHRRRPEAIKKVRGDTFVAQTNIHYPTDVNLVWDGVRKVLDLAPRLAKLIGAVGWRQAASRCRRFRAMMRSLSRAKSDANDVSKKYQPYLKEADAIWRKALTLIQLVNVYTGDRGLPREIAGLYAKLIKYMSLCAQVLERAERRLLQGEKIPNASKILSIFETHTELINRGKKPHPIEFGHRVLVVEDDLGFIPHHEILGKGVLDQDIIVPAMRQLQERFGHRIESASFDRGFHTPQNQIDLREILAHPCVPVKGCKQAEVQNREATVEFRKARQKHPGIESAIGALEDSNGLRRCYDKGYEGYERAVGLAVLARNLHALGKLLIVEEQPKSRAAFSKRRSLKRRKSRKSQKINAA